MGKLRVLFYKFSCDKEELAEKLSYALWYQKNLQKVHDLIEAGANIDHLAGGQEKANKALLDAAAIRGDTKTAEIEVADRCAYVRNGDRPPGLDRPGP